jgi:hypothetical protein
MKSVVLSGHNDDRDCRCLAGRAVLLAGTIRGL